MARNSYRSEPKPQAELRINRVTIRGQWRRARYSSRCKGVHVGRDFVGCRRPIERGDRVFWIPGDGVLCASCARAYELRTN